MMEKQRHVFKCPIVGCSLSFRAINSLGEHMNDTRLHPSSTLQGKPYRCDFEGCQWSFQKLYNLRRHQVSHSQQREHLCKACGKAFLRPDHLKSHSLKNCHEKTCFRPTADCGAESLNNGNQKKQGNQQTRVSETQRLSMEGCDLEENLQLIHSTANCTVTFNSKTQEGLLVGTSYSIPMKGGTEEHVPSDVEDSSAVNMEQPIVPTEIEMSEKNKAEQIKASFSATDFADPHTLSFPEIKTEIKREPEAEQFEEEEYKCLVDRDIKDEPDPLAPEEEDEKHTLADQITKTEIKEESSQLWDDCKIEYTIKEEERDAEDPLAPDPTTEVEEPMSEKNKAEQTKASFSATDFADPHTLSFPEIKTEIKREPEAEQFEEEEYKCLVDRDIKDEPDPLAPEEEDEKHTLADQITKTEIKEESSQLWDDCKIEYTIKEEERDAEDPLAPDPTTEVEEPEVGDAEDPLAPDPTTEVEEPMEEDSSDTANPTENTLVFHCRRCNKTYTSAHCLEMHQETCGGMRTNVPIDVSSLFWLVDGVRMYYCQFCEYKSNNSGHVKQHLATHIGESVFKCEVCGQLFTQASILNTHKRIHTPDRPHKCTQCDKAFTQAANLKKHMITHTGERAFKCEVCEKTFTQAYTLNTHKRIHTGKRLHKCTQCDRAFTQAGELKKHMPTHTGEKAFKCEVCEKTFTQSSSLNKHRLIHTGERPHKCTQCDRAFTQAGHLKAHMSTHTGERAFKCEVCDKAFTQLSTLDTHRLIHNCSLCEKALKINKC